MRRLVALTVSIAVIVVLVASVSFIVISERPHAAFISERAAGEISGQNYTQSIISTYGGSGLPLGSSKMWQVYYLNESSGSGFNYYFQIEILEFNNTTLAKTAYLLLAGSLSIGNISVTANGTFKGFYYTYVTVPQKVYENYGTAYNWGAWGYSGNVGFSVRGLSELPPNGNMSAVAIDQINAMTAFTF